MIQILAVSVLGFEPVAWSVPHIGNRRKKNGERYRFTTRGRKTDMAETRVGLKDWQDYVAEEAKRVMAGRPLFSGPLKVHFRFLGKTPPGFRHGELWDVRLDWDKKTECWHKRRRFNCQEADLTNLQKATEDALTGVVWVDDCKNRFIVSESLFAPSPGVKISISQIEPGDYPGYGDPVE